MKAWTTIESINTHEGALELRQRGAKDFLILVGGRVLMSSTASRSEVFLAQAACSLLVDSPAPKVLIGGLGMGMTLRAALDALPLAAKVHVVELNPVVERWCRGPLATVCDNALADSRVRLELGDVSHVISRAAAKRERYDAIIIDLYEGPNGFTQASDDPFYGPSALRRTHAALQTKGVFAVWGEDPDQRFERRLGGEGFDFERKISGKGASLHAVYLARPRRTNAARGKPKGRRRR